MQMIDCPNCQKRTGFKRAVGVGTFLMVILTCGLWLFVIPFYPARCITCGLPRREALPPWRQAPLIIVAGIALVSFVALVTGTKQQPPELAPIVKGPQYNEVPISVPTIPESVVAPNAISPSAPSERSPVSASAPAMITDESAEHTFREDGRVYSVALIAATHLSIEAEVLAQGKIAYFGYAGIQSRPFAVISDEKQITIRLMCAMTEDEGIEVASLYRPGEAVRVSGEYMGTASLAGNPSMPIISRCQVAGPQDNVIRPAENTQ
jgi:hypothetical protein